MMIRGEAGRKRVRAACRGPLSLWERARVRAGGRERDSVPAILGATPPLPPCRKRARGVASGYTLRERSRGFTLLEVLISSLLMTLVLATLWEVFHVYSRLFETGGIQARQARLVSALQRLFTDDLESAIEDSPRPNEASAGSSVRRFGLQGSAHTLRVDVLQMLPDDQLPAGQDSSSLGQASASRPQVPELRTVVYRFVGRRHSLGESLREDATPSGNESSPEGSLPRPGLTRWEIDFETPLEKTSGRPQPVKEPTDEANPEPSSPDTAGGASFEDMAAGATTPEATTWLPEVRRATFRYFDGRGWSDSWNSLQRGSLPVAVEVKLRLRDPAEANHRRRPKDEPEATAEEPDDSTEETPSGGNQPPPAFAENGLSVGNQQPAYRFLIRLPVAQHRPELKAAQTSSPGFGISAEGNLPLSPVEEASNAVPSPALAPSPSSPRGPTEHPDSSLPDGWLRSVP